MMDSAWPSFVDGSDPTAAVKPCHPPACPPVMPIPGRFYLMHDHHWVTVDGYGAEGHGTERHSHHVDQGHPGNWTNRSHQGIDAVPWHELPWIKAREADTDPSTGPFAVATWTPFPGLRVRATDLGDDRYGLETWRRIDGGDYEAGYVTLGTLGGGRQPDQPHTLAGPSAPQPPGVLPESPTPGVRRTLDDPAAADDQTDSRGPRRPPDHPVGVTHEPKHPTNPEGTE